MSARLVNVMDGPQRPPSLPDVTWWAEDDPPWRERVDHLPVDVDRTRRLADFDDRIRLNGGTPLQLTGTRTTRTRNREIPATLRNLFPTVQVPFPPVVWVNQSTSDFEWFGIDPENDRYFEATEVGPVTLARWQVASLWAVGYLRTFDLNKPWHEQRPGLCGAGLPMWPMVPTIDELNAGAGGIGHAMHFIVSGGYGTEPPVWPARKTDGTVPGHPLRAGSRIRFTRDAMYDLLDQAKTNHDLAIAIAGHEHGFIVNDRTAPVGHAVRLPDHPDLNVTIRPRLTDCELVQ